MQLEIDFEKEEINQYFLGSEIMDNVMQNSALWKGEMIRRLSCRTTASTNIRSEDTYLMEFNEELTEALKDCVRHHQMLIAFNKMIENFFNVFFLFKSIQTSLQLCNIFYTFIKVSKLKLRVI